MTDAEYADGVGAIRCPTCRQMLRDGAAEPTVAVRRRDVAAIVARLAFQSGDDVAALVERLARILGQTTAQIRENVGDSGPE